MIRWLSRFLTVIAACAVATAALATEHEVKPGKQRWPIKTSVLPEASLAHRIAVTYGDLVKLDDPPDVTKNDHRFQSARIPAFPNPHGLKEGDIVTVTGWLHLVAGESDGDYHIQISDSRDSQARCLIVEVPKDDEAFVTSGAVRERAKAVREFVRATLLRGSEPSSRGSVMQRPAFVAVTGQLFYDDAHVGDAPRGKKGCQAETLWEIHPITDMTFAPQ